MQENLNKFTAGFDKREKKKSEIDVSFLKMHLLVDRTRLLVDLNMGYCLAFRGAGELCIG